MVQKKGYIIMKKIIDLIKPFLSIVFGALVILLFLNDISEGDTKTTRAIFALLVGGYIIGVGLIKFLMGKQLDAKLSRILDATSIATYAGLFFVIIITYMIDYAAEDMMLGRPGYGANGWIIAIYSLLAAAGFASVFLAATFVRNEVLNKVSNLLGLLFLLALVLNVTFTVNRGDPINLGAISVLTVVVHVLFGYIYLAFAATEEVPARRSRVRQHSTPQVEERPAEEEVPIVEE